MIVRKYISLLLALFILFVNSSATIVFHSCHDEIAYVTLNYQEKSLANSADENSCCSPKKEEKKTDGCCSNQEIKVDKKIDYSLASELKVLFQAAFVSIKMKQNGQQTLPTKTQENINYTYDSHAPPIYKLNSQLLFYA